MNKKSSDGSIGNRNFPVMTLFATLLFVCAILQFLWMEHSWQQAAASVADAKARLVGEALRQRLQFQEQFLTSFQPYTSADASSMELQMENYCRQHPEVVYAAIANDSERVISKAGSGISHDVGFVVPEIPNSSGYSDGPKYNESRTLLGSQIFARSDHGQWSITTMISYKELLKSVIIGDQLGGYEARLLDVKGDILSSTGAAGDGSKPRAEYSIAVGAARMLLEVTDVAGSFWTPWMLLLAALEAILFLAMFFSLWRTGRRFRLVRRSDYAAYQQTAYFKALWDTAEDAMKLTDRNGQTVLVNTAYSILFQISPEKAREESAGMPESGGRADLEAFTRQFDAGTLKVATSQMIRRSNGVEIPVEISHSYITTADGERLLLSVFHNISERKKMEEQLQEVQRMESVGALAEEIGNDFKNILGIVLNAAERLKNQVPATPEADECLEMITSASRRGGDLASDLLIFSRSDESDMMPILVNQNLEQAKTVLDRSLAPGIKVLVTAQNRSAAVRGNGRRLTQVIVNLCLSAQSRMQKGGTISVRSDIIDSSAVRKQLPAAAQADYIKISVTDDGLPLSDLDLRRIIEPYFSSQKGTRGAGLRLSVVHSIIRSHKGFMAAMNGKDGKTTFSVYLPVDHYEGEKERAALPEDYYFSGNELLLFVDDEEAFRQLMTVEFQRRGLRVITAADGEEALRLYKEKKNEIAIVVSDLSMPKMDGEELFSNLFALDPLVRFIFVTGNLEHQLKLDLLRRGVRDIVEKPFEFDKLVAAVQQVLAGL